MGSLLSAIHLLLLVLSPFIFVTVIECKLKSVQIDADNQTDRNPLNSSQSDKVVHSFCITKAQCEVQHGNASYCSRVDRRCHCVWYFDSRANRCASEPEKSDTKGDFSVKGDYRMYVLLLLLACLLLMVSKWSRNDDENVDGLSRMERFRNSLRDSLIRSNRIVRRFVELLIEGIGGLGGERVPIASAPFLDEIEERGPPPPYQSIDMDDFPIFEDDYDDDERDWLLPPPYQFIDSNESSRCVY